MNPQRLEVLLPLACAWAAEQERVALRSGVALTADQTADARRVGVRQPERVRLLRVAEIPTPDDPDLAAAAAAVRLISPFTVGLTLGYGIFIHTAHWDQRSLVVHELAHTMQYERSGGIEAFLRQYLHECLTAGYPDAPLEREAERLEREICG